MSLTGVARYPMRGSGFVVLDVRDFGATPSVVGGGDPIQDAIDAVIENPTHALGIYIPTGTWRLTTPLVIKNDTTFCRVNMFGGSLVAFPDSATLGGAVLQLDGDGTGNELELPVLIIQGARCCTFDGIDFYNTGNPTPSDIREQDHRQIFTLPDVADWVSAGVRTNRYSPHCAVAVDPFINGDPGGAAANKYPGLEAHYDTSAYSSALVFRHCTFRGGYWGTVVTPSGGGANGENFLFDTCFWQENTRSFGQGQSQSRANELRSPKMAAAWCHIDDREIGPGGNAGIAPIVTGAPNLGICRYLFNLGLVAPWELSRAHAEAFASIGKLGVGAAGAQEGAILRSSTFNMKAARELSPNDLEIDFHLMTWGQCLIENCTFSVGEFGPLRFWNQTPGRTVIRGCRFTDADVNDRVQVGFAARDSSLVLEHAQSRNTGIGAVYEQDPITSSVTTTSIGGGLDVTVVQDGTVLSRGIVALADTTGLAEGDIVEMLPTTANQVVPQTLDSDQFAYGYQAAVGRITSVTANTSIQIDGLPLNFPFGVSVRLRAVTWDNSGGSD